jgi:hypothetical protein
MSYQTAMKPMNKGKKTMARQRYEWQRCASSGDSFLNNGNTRIRRMSFNDGTHFYYPEYWGDYSPRKYPVHGPLQTTLHGAQRWLKQQKGKCER